MCSPRALVAPPLPVTRVGCLIEEAHSRDQRCPANYHTLINRTRVARDSISPLSPAVSRSPPPNPAPHFPLPYRRLLVSSRFSSPLSPPSHRPYPLSSFVLHAWYARRAYGLTVRECHGSDRFSRPRTVDAASGERRTGVVR